MMKMKWLGFLLFIFCTTVFAQSKQELDKVMLSKDAKEISGFIKKYPKNSNAPFLERKLSAISGNSSKVNSDRSAKTTNTVGDAEKPKNIDKSPIQENSSVERDAKTQKKLDVINHLFSNDPNRKESYIKIKNKSDCNINVKIEGKKTYFLDVPKKGENYIMIPKGIYKVTTLICTAQYSSTKNLSDNFEIVLEVAKKAKK